MIKRLHPNVHTINLEYAVFNKFLLLSDLHWDNPKCNRELLKKHLDQAKAEKVPVLVNGDFFCLMQGKGDPRRSKDDVRPEHNNARYLDSIVESAVEWFKPYVDILQFIGYGNHETQIIKHQETDLLKRFADLFNLTHKPKNPIHIGGYGGWLIFKCVEHPVSFKTHYFHGSGGGGVVTKNMIQHQRQNAMIEGADMIWNGHVHELYHGLVSKHYIDQHFNPKIKDVHFLQTATYKEEFNNRKSGWHVERGAPPKPLGGYWAEFKPTRYLSKPRIIEAKLYQTN